MRVLLIEDNQDVIGVFRDFARRESILITVAASQESALVELEAMDHEFDLAVCDLKIPTTDGAIDDEVSLGLGVLRTALARWPGVPVIVLSAFGTLDMVADMLLAARQRDVYGVGIEMP